ncbi:MAG TPA: putative cytokinetic ring protein SteA [Thermoleophilaceae bacterium]|nr:putative cytokinetic ring protein SteA [Thermoleophilaceae bacterium]
MAAPRLRRRAARSGANQRPGNGRAPDATGAHTGAARLGKRTKRLVKRLGPGDIAVIDHADIDRVSGEDLVATGVRCVVNVASSSSGRYPNQGPLVLVQGGVHLVDVPGSALFEELSDGEHITVRGGEVLRGDEVVASGAVLDEETLTRMDEEARRTIGEALEQFAENTMRHVLDERELLAGNIDLPDFDTDIRDRPVLIVVRGVGHQRDLRILRPYVRDVRPALIAVDGGADAILEEGFKPDMIVGDMDSASDGALRSGAELIVHAYPDGRAPGRDRLDALGLAYKVVPAPATSEDVAMLIAAEKGAEVIVMVGSHFNLVEFLDKNRRGMSSTFLTRLRLGEIIVDAKGVSRLHRPSAGRGPILVLCAAALATFGVVVVTSPSLGPFLDLVWLKIQVLLGID